MLAKRTTIRTKIRPTMRSKFHGFTLIELLIAISLMAVISIMCWRGLDGVLRSRDWLVTQSDDLKGMTSGFAQMEDDLRRSWMTKQMKLTADTIDFTTSDSANNRIALSLLRDGAQVAPGQVQQVSYRVRDGVFERGFSRWVLPDPANTKLNDRFESMTWQPLFEKVDSAAWRVFVPGAGWVDGKTWATPVQAAQPGAKRNAALGVEVTLKRIGNQSQTDLTIVRVFGVRD
jgi:general secretion pathway protein J